jgi:hypothetical protein
MTVVCVGLLLASGCFDWERFEHGDAGRDVGTEGDGGARAISGYALTSGTDASRWVDACAAASHWSASWTGPTGDDLTDDGEWWVPAPYLPADFAFAFYDEAPITGVHVAVDGALAFRGSIGTYATAARCPLSASARATVSGAYPFWDDLQAFPSGPMNHSALCAAVLGDAPARRFVVTWSDVGLFNAPDQNTHLTFSVVLTETANTVEFVYKTLTINVPGHEGGANAAVGLLGSAAVQSVQYSCKQGTLGDGAWVLFTPM